MIDCCGRKINYLRLSLTNQCNLHCEYCSPRDNCSLSSHMLEDRRVIEIAETATQLGIDKIRLTGGEPMLRRNFINICAEIRDLRNLKKLAITTNGCYLEKHICDLRQIGIDQINISLDTLNAHKYRELTGGELGTVLRGLECLEKENFPVVKINAVLIRNFNDDWESISSMINLTRDADLDLRFIELMPMPNSTFSLKNYVSAGKIMEMIKQHYDIAGKGILEGTAKMYRIDGFRGRIGFIAPLSGRFCASCNRIRITADGTVIPCLHGKTEIPLGNLSSSEIKKILSEVIFNKPSSHDLKIGMASANRIMCAIGG